MKDNVTVIRRDQIGYNGKLINQTLIIQRTRRLPPSAVLSVRTGSLTETMHPRAENITQAMILLKALSMAGAVWRSARPHLPRPIIFLNVMYATDADNLEPVDEAD